MRGSDQAKSSLISYVDLEERVPARHPLRKIRAVVTDALRSLGVEFDRLYAGEVRRSIAPVRLIRASLLQILYSIRSKRQLMAQMDYTLLFRWFLGLGSWHRRRRLGPDRVHEEPRPAADHGHLGQDHGRHSAAS